MSKAATLDDLRSLAAAGQLYAVIDACDTPLVPEKAAELGETRAVSLYRGSADEMYWAFAPYLFVVDGDLLDWIVADLWSQPWGIFAVADADLETVRRHFRRFLLVQTPDAEQWYFRFYDPRICEWFFRIGTDVQQSSFFSALRSVYVPKPISQLIEYSLREQGRTRRIIRLAKHHRPSESVYSHPSTYLWFSPLQLARFEDEIRRRFEMRAGDHLLATLADLCVTKQPLESWCESTSLKAKTYGFLTEIEVVRFMECRMILESRSSIEHCDLVVENICARLSIPARTRLHQLAKAASAHNQQVSS